MRFEVHSLLALSDYATHLAVDSQVWEDQCPHGPSVMLDAQLSQSSFEFVGSTLLEFVSEAISWKYSSEIEWEQLSATTPALGKGGQLWPVGSSSLWHGPPDATESRPLQKASVLLEPNILSTTYIVDRWYDEENMHQRWGITIPHCLGLIVPLNTPRASEYTSQALVVHQHR